MEWGEAPEVTALRELEEETGLAATLGPVLGVFSRWYTAEESALGGTGHAVGVVYEATAATGELRTTWDGDTTDAAAWFTIEEIDQLARVELLDYVLGLL